MMAPIKIGLAWLLLAGAASRSHPMSAAACLRALSLNEMVFKVASTAPSAPHFIADTTTETSHATVSRALFETTVTLAESDVPVESGKALCDLLRAEVSNKCAPAVPLYNLTVNARSAGDWFALVDTECSLDFSSDSATALLEALFIKQQNRTLRIVLLATTWEPKTK
jgi:hypothetical protein